MHRYFLDEPIESTIQINSEKAVYHHLVRVRRAKVGTTAEFVDPRQRLVIGKVTGIEGSGATVEVTEELKQSVELPVQVTVIVSPVKNDRTDWFVQKATELGVDRIVLTKMARTVVDWGKQQEKKRTRFEKIALNAAEQAHRLKVPEIVFENYQEAVLEAKDQGLVAWEESAKKGEQAQLVKTAMAMAKGERLAILFGPEGGLSEEEISHLADQGFLPAGLGPRILRAETAPLYALSALSTIWELQAKR
ncbi:16S rRNA (uracil(1498)-N(3))-methyltransferase [Fructobacillus sp. M1-13]|uniref:Ribosomal RNA small subunit methyltransferase E n=1 Tax=Fructobacillus papyriferae TaxID=2713171 RepID=A0ABS5QQH2_9LACO|nr:RsmE family RNA methyltransferase [Fructobacillus papyriferae]MBS9334745.1 16S rRNA (uracil(1498)-N(3))-methyltransferase [Fructobacillus papyriferae]MCD2158735.1 16S rRNA (uracil(1498)-N(3))-methyltransferase [Fructobacillus papyriferae]